jgi:hypothetical protein
MRLLLLAIIFCFTTGVANITEFQELPKKGQGRWMVDQVPNNITLYWDLNFDGKIDVVYACPITGYGSISTCDIKLDVGKNDYLFTNCPSDRPLYYLTSKECWVCNVCKDWSEGKGKPLSVRSEKCDLRN